MLRADPRFGCISDDQLMLVATQSEVRAIDHHAIETLGMPGRLLMEIAGFQASNAIMARLGHRPGRAVILCGPGNNGGDGYVVARHLRDHGWDVHVVAFAAPRPGGDAAANADLWNTTGGRTLALPQADEAFAGCHLVVDALFGTGFDRAPDAALADLLQRANDAPGLGVALDLPTGLDGTTGRTGDAVFRADLTLSFGLLKTGLLTGAGPDVCGDIIALPIGWPMVSVATIGPSCRRPTPAWVAAQLPLRAPSGHKGTSGHVAILGGLAGREGAARLAALGALRAGIGLCTWVRRDPPVERLPELMADDPFVLGTLPARANALVIGPGLGHDDDAQALLAMALHDPRPRVFDADTLTSNLLAHPPHHPERIIVTPHPLEAARLLNTTVDAVQADRVGAARAIATALGGTCLLKGRNPIVAAPERPTFILDITAPALSTGGTGDVLAGLCGALLAQGLPTFEAAVVAAELHGRAGREAGLAVADRGVLASEIADRIPGIIASLLAGFAI